MRRRALLASLTVGLGSVAGCSAPRGYAATTDAATDTATAPTTDPATSTPDGTDTPTDSGTMSIPFGSLSFVDLETADRTYCLYSSPADTPSGTEIQLRFTSAATADSPATVEAVLRNNSSTAKTIELGSRPPFGRPASDPPHPMGEKSTDRTKRSSLVFAPTENHELTDGAAEIRRASDGFWRMTDETVPEFPAEIRVGSGNSIRGEYALVGRAAGVGRGRPIGVYEFSQTDERRTTVTVWQTSAPGPATESRFSGLSLPPLPGDSEVAWFHEADATTPTFVRPSVEQTTLPARVDFDFLNRSRETTECGGWTLYKLQNGQWFDLGPYFRTMVCLFAPPGLVQSQPMQLAGGPATSSEAAAYGFLGGGRYAAVVNYGHATGRSGALVDVDAPPVTIVPTDDVTTETSDGVVTATSSGWRTAPDEEGRERATLELSRVASADERLIPEQVMRRRYRVLRNTLAVIDSGVERVRLRTDESTANSLSISREFPFEFYLGERAYVLESVP